MTEQTVHPDFDPCNPEDYTGDCCLLVRESGKKRHAKREVLIEAADLPLVSGFDWKAYPKDKSKRRQPRYIVRYVTTGFLSFQAYQLHREIMKPPPDKLVDHRHRNPQDNRRRFLRVCTHQQNAWNTSKKKGKSHSKYKGVTRQYGCSAKWVAHITVDGKRRRLGGFYTQEHAAQA